MSTTRALISVEEYLASVYQPDRDYVDGELLERNMGERDHSFVQGLAIAYFAARRKEWNITVLPEMRVQVKRTRFRIPDVCIVLRRNEGTDPCQAAVSVHRNPVA